MNSLRVARAALRVRPTAFAAPLARRGYADVASDKIKLSLALPHQVCLPASSVSPLRRRLQNHCDATLGLQFDIC